MMDTYVLMVIGILMTYNESFLSDNEYLDSNGTVQKYEINKNWSNDYYDEKYNEGIRYY